MSSEAAGERKPSPVVVILSRGYHSTIVAAAPDREPCPGMVSYLVFCSLSAIVIAALKVCIRDTDRTDVFLAILREYGFSKVENTRTVPL
jgi:mTERF domain-containing protein